MAESRAQRVSIGASVSDAKGVSCYIALFTYVDVDALTPRIREGKRGSPYALPRQR